MIESDLIVKVGTNDFGFGIFGRANAWNNNFPTKPGWSIEDCRVAGARVVTELVERHGLDAGRNSEGVLRTASKIAITEPPLIGQKLLEFLEGTAAEISHRKETI